MKQRLPFRFIEPTFFAGLLDDPLLLLHARPLGKSLLFDCGQLHHLAKRVLKSITALFISHAHMDHFMGIDTFIRHNHVSPKTVDIFGPPGIDQKMASKLASYDWNLAEPCWCTFRVHEIAPGRIATSLFTGAEGFTRRATGEELRIDTTIYRNAWLKVDAALCDHIIPSLAFRVTERESFAVDEGKIEGAGLVRGDWLRLLKKRFHDGAFGTEPLTVLGRRGEIIENRTVEDAGALYGAIRKEQKPGSIGYMTDIGFSDENLEKIILLMEGVTLLVCECSFLAEERDKARVSHHLCTSDLNFLMDRLRPRFVLPMHLSKSYQERSHLLYEQLEAPPGVTLLQIPDHLTPRPLLASEVPRLFYHGNYA